jgi:hypothetical protein
MSWMIRRRRRKIHVRTVVTRKVTFRTYPIILPKDVETESDTDRDTETWTLCRYQTPQWLCQNEDQFDLSGIAIYHYAIRI